MFKTVIWMSDTLNQRAVFVLVWSNRILISTVVGRNDRICPHCVNYDQSTHSRKAGSLSCFKCFNESTSITWIGLNESSLVPSTFGLCVRWINLVYCNSSFFTRELNTWMLKMIRKLGEMTEISVFQKKCLQRWLLTQNHSHLKCLKAFLCTNSLPRHY